MGGRARQCQAQGSPPPDGRLAGGAGGPSAPRRLLPQPRRGWVAGRPRMAPAAAVAEGRGPQTCGPSGCRGRCARPPARPRAQLLFKGQVGHVARTQLAAAGQELRGWAAPLRRRRRRRRQRTAPDLTGRPEWSSRERDAGSHGRGGARPGKRPGARTPRRAGRPSPPREPAKGLGPAAWSGLAARPPRPRLRPRPAPPRQAHSLRRPLASGVRARLQAERPGGPNTRPGGGARRAAPTSGDRLGFLVTLQMTRLAFEESGRFRRPLSH